MQRQQERAKLLAERQDRDKQDAESFVVRLQVQREKLMEAYFCRKKRQREMAAISGFGRSVDEQ